MGKADWSAEQRWWRLSTPILKSLYNRTSRLLGGNQGIRGDESVISYFPLAYCAICHAQLTNKTNCRQSVLYCSRRVRDKGGRLVRICRRARHHGLVKEEAKLGLV